MSHYLGIDLGTSSVKALLVSNQGDVVGKGNADYPILQPMPGYAEQDPEAWWQAAVMAVREALAVGKPIEVTAIGVCGQMHGTVLLDQHHRCLAPAIIWPDQRSHRQVDAIGRQVALEEFVALAGGPVATGFQLATLRWFREEKPEIWNSISRILLPKDYLRWRLTGSFYTDPSDACGTLLLDVSCRAWSEVLVAFAQVEVQQLPPLAASGTLVGELTSDAAEQLGLRRGVPVVAGAADTASSALGAGIIDSDSLLLTLSTAGQLVWPLASPKVDTLGRIHTFCSALEPSAGAGWYAMGGTLSAGLALRWLRDSVLCITDDAEFDALVRQTAELPAGTGGLLFLPYLVGERTPHMDPHARAVFFGLSLQHGRLDLLRAVMEGVALAGFEAFMVLANLGAAPGRLILAGGAARFQVWQQILADVFALPTCRLTVSEQSALGAALLAGAGIGAHDIVSAAQHWSTYDEAVVPIPHHTAVYRERLAAFQGLYHKHKDEFRQPL